MAQIAPTPNPAVGEDSSAVGLSESGTAGSRLARTARSIAATGVAAAVLLGADLMTSRLVLVALLGGSPWPWWGIVAVGVASCAVIAAAARLLTSRLRIVGPIAVTVLAGLLGGLAFVTGNLTPFPAEPATPVAHLLICVGCGLVLGLFLGPLELRVLGGLAMALVVMYAANIAPALPEDNRPPANGDRARIEASFEDLLANGTRPLITDQSGWEVVDVDASGGSAGSVVVSPAGGIVTIVVDSTPQDAMWEVDAFTCWQLVDRYSIPDTTTTFADWSDRCAKTDSGWEAIDQSAFAWARDEALVLAFATKEHYAAAGTRPATAAEITELRSDLRPMTEPEMREALADDFLGPNP